MSDATDRPDEDNDDLDAWMKTLRGEGDPQDDDRTGRAIRTIVRAEQKIAEESIDDERLEHGKQKLMFRLQRERLLTGRPLWQQAPIAMAASLAIAALVAVFTFTNIGVGPDQDAAILLAYGEVDRMRGGYPDAIEIETAQPDEDSRQLAERLRTIRVPFELRVDQEAQSARVLRIQNDGIENRGELEALLHDIGIDVPNQSVIVVRFIESG